MAEKKKAKVLTQLDIFKELKKEVSLLDCVSFAENHLTIDGKPFNLSNSGWRYMGELYRMVSAQIENKSARPIVLLKGRQVGATIMAGVLSLHMAASGLYGSVANKPAIRVMHAFPDLKRCSVYAKEILASLMSGATEDYISKRSMKTVKSAIEDSQTEKNFVGNNRIRVDSMGVSGDRIRGSTQDILMLDECVISKTCIETEIGKVTIKTLVDNHDNGIKNPRVLSYNIQKELFEYKEITSSFKFHNREVAEVIVGKRKFTATLNHRMLTANGYVPVKKLQIGDVILSSIKGERNAVKSVRILDKRQTVYDIEVKDNHNFIITSGKSSKNMGGLLSSNCQDMTQRAIENTLRILTASPYGATTQGVQVYFGTPKHAGSYFWQIWQNSDKRFYNLRCTDDNCAHYFQLYNLENDDWNEIWVENQTVACPKCKKKQKKQDASDLGKWVITRPFDDLGKVPKYIGYHFNMMLSPLYNKEQVMEYWPEHNKNASERAWKNETKGEFFSASATPLTLEDVYNNCMNYDRGIAKSIVDPSGKYYFLGMDWGQKVETEKDAEAKRGQSYTCAVILSVDSTGTFTVENAVRLKKNEFSYKVQVIKKLMKDFHIDQAAADFYYANDLVPHMQQDEGLGDKFLGCQNLGTVTKMFSYNEKDIQVKLNKDMLLDELFKMFKNGKIKFPAKGDSAEILMWLVEHCTSMETHVKMREGLALPTYQKGTIQNDGLMALMYAYTAYKFKVTNKFTNYESEAVKKEKSKALLPVLGHIPRMK